MLCPEVWNFNAPQSTFTTQKKNFNEGNHVNTINSFIYNHLVSVILPESIKVPEKLIEALRNDCDYYKLDKVKLSEFVSEDFIRNFVNSGKCNLYVLSVGTRLDCDNCASVSPEGHLILNLNKSTYQGSGLEGTVSHFHSITKDRYNDAKTLTRPHPPDAGPQSRRRSGRIPRAPPSSPNFSS